jgi:hypothetical protein
VADARAAVSPEGLGRVRDLLRDAATDLSEADGALEGRALAADDFEGEAARLSGALARSLNLVVDAYSDDARVVPGQKLRISAALWNADSAGQAVDLCPNPSAADWRLATDSQSVPLPACLGSNGTVWAPLHPGVQITTAIPGNTLSVAKLEASIPGTWQPTTPYFLREPRNGDLYQWDPAAKSSWGLPFEDPLLSVEARVLSRGATAILPREVTYRTNDQANGEIRLPITLVPRVDLKLEPGAELWRQGDSTGRRFVVTVTHGARDSTSGTVQLEVPEGWPRPKAQPFSFSREDERASYTFLVRPPKRMDRGPYEIRAVAVTKDGSRYDVGQFTVAYPHIRPMSYTKPAVATITTAPLVLPRTGPVAYIRGAADRVPEALQSVGLSLQVITGKDLERDDLSRFRTIIVGPRAYETDPDLEANNDRLLAFARRGGLVLVQYQQYDFFLNGYAAYPLTVGSRAPGTAAPPTATRPGSSSVGGTALLGGHERVTDENAPVAILRPVHSVLLGPNKIGPDDWNGWVQERGLYFAHSWDPAFKPVLEMHDPGEGPLEGSLLIAKTGSGTYVYTGLSFFRQLPAGVPGAFRLFANLLALAGTRER